MPAHSASSTTSAAAFMDRISDRLGSLIPGGSQWPPRHPLKVSLVMGVLGMVSVWVTFISLLILWKNVGLFYAQPYAIFGIGVWFGLAILAPASIWLGRSLWIAIVWIVLAGVNSAYSREASGVMTDLIAGVPGIGMLFGENRELQGQLELGLRNGVFLGVVGCWLIKRWSSWFVGGSIAVNCLSKIIVCFTPYVHRMRYAWSWELLDYQETLFFLAMENIPAALWVGTLVWNRLPPSIAEPPESP